MAKPSSQAAKPASLEDVEPLLPATYEEMVHAISASYDRLSKRLRQIAGYSLDHPNDFAIALVTG